MNRALVKAAALGVFILLAQPAIFALPWGVIPLGFLIIVTFVVYKPLNILHPNILVFSFYLLWLVIPSNLSLILYLVDWQYVLPWGQLTFWNDFSIYTLLQVELTFLTLYLGCHFFGNPRAQAQRDYLDTRAEAPSISDASALFLSAATLAMVLLFINQTGGWDAWISNYSQTYLTGREGLGPLNLALITLGNLTVFLLGLRNHARRGGLVGLIPALVVILPLGYVGGFKSRVMFLLFLFMLPYLTRTAPRIAHMAGLLVVFIAMLYVLTLVRTSGFYAKPEAFLEMMVGYFNSYPLHDQIVKTKDPAFLQTVFQIFTKPMQYIGFASADADFDISVMLTKEFFPDQWNLGRGTQQWPLETDLYLNYYGIWLQWIPLLIYAGFLSNIFRAAVIRHRYSIMPIYAMEFLRIVSTLRGALLPWTIPVLIVQYSFIYIVTRKLVEFKTFKSIDSRTTARDNADLVYYALCNERQLDIHFSTHVAKSADAKSLPQYKVFKLQVWRRQLGRAFWPAIFFMAAGAPLLALVQWVGAVVAAVSGSGPAGRKVFAWATSAQNRRLIDKAVSGSDVALTTDVGHDLRGVQQLAAALGVAGVLRCIGAHIRVFDRIVLVGPARIDLLLHARDAFQILLLTEYARIHPETIFITDSHCQRWAYILSHRARKFWLVQHGFLDDGIHFPYAFGRVERLICRDPRFIHMFRRYYEVDDTAILTADLTLQRNEFSDEAVFLASSALSIDAEIELLSALKAERAPPIIVKLHPRHQYDDRANTLKSLADYVAGVNEFPDCRLLVTFNSFIEFDYRAKGKPAVSIEREGSVELAMAAIRRELV